MRLRRTKKLLVPNDCEVTHIRVGIRFKRQGIASASWSQPNSLQAWLMRLKSAPTRDRARNAGQRRHLAGLGLNQEIGCRSWYPFGFPVRPGPPISRPGSRWQLRSFHVSRFASSFLPDAVQVGDPGAVIVLAKDLFVEGNPLSIRREGPEAALAFGDGEQGLGMPRYRYPPSPAWSPAELITLIDQPIGCRASNPPGWAWMVAAVRRFNPLPSG